MEQKKRLALEALKRASKDVESDPGSSGDDGGATPPSMKALLALETRSDDLLSGDPNLSSLSNLLSRLRSLVQSLKSIAKDTSSCSLRSVIRSFFRRRSRNREIARVAGSIGDELQSWIDRDFINRLVTVLRSSSSSSNEKAALLSSLESRLADGFDRDLQTILLRLGVYSAVESALADAAAPTDIRERAAAAVLALVKFNKAVFVAPVLMGPAVRDMISIGSSATLQSLCGLIKSIRSPIVDELLANGDLPRLTSLLTAAADAGAKIAAFCCVLAVAYHGRKEAIEAMLEAGLIKRLMALQRSPELGGSIIELEENEVKLRPFAGAVARLAVEIEVGEGLRGKEKRVMKVEIVRRVKEAAAAEAEVATVLFEVLWGATCW